MSVLVIRVAPDLAIPGWASSIGALFLVVLMQTVTMSLFFSFLVLSGRNAVNYLPCRSATTITLCWTSRGYTLRHIDGVYLHRIRARTLQPHLELWRAYYTNLIRPYLGEEVISGGRGLQDYDGFAVQWRPETLGLPRTRPGARTYAGGSYR